MPVAQGQFAAVENVHLAAVEHFHAIEDSGCVAKILEEQGIAGSGDAGGMLRDADQLQIPVCRLECQFPNGSEGVTAHNGVHVHVRN